MFGAPNTALRRRERMQAGFGVLGHVLEGFVSVALWVLWRIMHGSIVAILMLMEPVVRIVLVPLAFTSFLMALFFGFVFGEPHFPKWGMRRWPRPARSPEGRGRRLKVLPSRGPRGGCEALGAANGRRPLRAKLRLVARSAAS